MELRDKQILQIALPSIVSNITVPLLGLVDVAIVGHMGDAAYIGAVAVGSMIFNLVYWLFAFLRMGTSGMTSQALGRRDLAEDTRILVRSTLTALAIAVSLLVLQVPLRWLMFELIGPTSDVAPFARTYYNIVIWGAPAMLCLYSLTGWFIGMQNTRFPMLISITQNVVNIVASLCLVYGLGMRIEGVATGTVIAQYAGLLMAVGLLRGHYGKIFRWHGSTGARGREATIPASPHTHTPAPPKTSPLLQSFRINRDIFLRTLCLVAVNLYFTSMGARSGAIILSVNTVLMQLYLFYSYFMDGFAYAGEALGGRFHGARNGVAFHEMLRHLFGWAAAVMAVYTAVYVAGGQWIVSLLTDEPQVVQTAREYIGWVWLVPVASTLAFIWDGVFIGITATRGMLVSSFCSALLFFAVSRFTANSIGNHGLWLAMIIYLLMRGVVQSFWFKSKINHTI